MSQNMKLQILRFSSVAMILNLLLPSHVEANNCGIVESNMESERILNDFLFISELAALERSQKTLVKDRDIATNPRELYEQYLDVLSKSDFLSHNEIQLHSIEPQIVLRADLILRIFLADRILATKLGQEKADGLWRAHRLGGVGPYDLVTLRKKYQILLDSGFSREETTTLMRLGLAGTKYNQQFYTGHSQSQGNQIIGNISADDAGRVPPGVRVSKPHSNVFEASTPFAKFRTELEARDGYVNVSNTVEASKAVKVMGFAMGGPIGSLMASKIVERGAKAIHEASVSAQQGYRKAEGRK